MDSPRKEGTALSVTLPYTISLTLRRSDSRTKPLIFRWPQAYNFRRSRFVIIHESTSGFVRLEVPEMYTDKTSLDDVEQLEVGHQNCLWELPSAGEVGYGVDLTDNYQKLLIPGEKYHLFWPGGEIDMWEWGTKTEWTGKQLRVRSTENKLSRLLLPASNVLSFTAKEEDMSWPDRVAIEKWTDPNGKSLSMGSINRLELDWRRKQAPLPLPSPLGPEARV
jgi:hypothetical protein